MTFEHKQDVFCVWNLIHDDFCLKIDECLLWAWSKLACLISIFRYQTKCGWISDSYCCDDCSSAHCCVFAMTISMEVFQFHDLFLLFFCSLFVSLDFTSKLRYIGIYQTGYMGYFASQQNSEHVANTVAECCWAFQGAGSMAITK